MLEVRAMQPLYGSSIERLQGTATPYALNSARAACLGPTQLADMSRKTRRSFYSPRKDIATMTVVVGSRLIR